MLLFFFCFVFSKKPFLVKRKYIVKNISKGRLRMIQIENFTYALKITWLRRHILQEHCTRNTLSELNLTEVFSRGDHYAYLKSEEIGNPFLKDTLQSLKIFCKTVLIETVEDMLCSPNWFNSKFNQGQNLFIKEWYDKRIRNIVDLLDNEGNFYQYNDLKNKYNINGTFLDYYSILRKMPIEWKTKILENSLLCQHLKNNVEQNCYVSNQRQKRKQNFL